MTRVIVSEDCGNSPKNLFLQKLTIAFADRDTKFILESVTDDIRWNILSDNLIEGKDNFAKALKKLRNDTTREISIQHIATHGKAGFVNGIKKFRIGKTYAYCDAYIFNNTKGTTVKEITSYLIEIK
jgi:hypothetical protein